MSSGKTNERRPGQYGMHERRPSQYGMHEHRPGHRMHERRPSTCNMPSHPCNTRLEQACPFIEVLGLSPPDYDAGTTIAPPATTLTADRSLKSWLSAVPLDGCACRHSRAPRSSPCSACSVPVRGSAWTSVVA